MVTNSERVQTRSAALTLACQVVAPESPPGHYLSTARQFERYIASGVSLTGAGGRSGVQVPLSDDTLLRLDGPDVTPELAERLTTAVKSVLRLQ